MEVWFDGITKEVKAVYSHRYNGTVWNDLGYLSHEGPEPLPSAMRPGAILDFVDGKPVVKTPAPVPMPVPSRQDILKADYAAASTDRDKLAVLARAAGLVPGL